MPGIAPRGHGHRQDRGLPARRQRPHRQGPQVLAGGAAGMILYNPSAAVTDLETDNHYLPAIHLAVQLDALLNFVTGHTNVNATWAPGVGHGRTTPDVMAYVLVARPGRRLREAGRHRARRAGARRHDADARPDDRRQRAAGPQLHGDRGHLDVEPALGRRLRARQGGASGLDARRDQVGADDLVGAGRRQGGRRNPGDPFDRAPARFAPTARSTRRSSSTRRTRTTSPRRPIRCTASTSTSRASMRRRCRADHDQADGDNVSAATRTSRSRPSRLRRRRSSSRTRRRARRAEVDDTIHLKKKSRPTSGSRSALRTCERAVLRPDHLDPQKDG